MIGNIAKEKAMCVPVRVLIVVIALLVGWLLALHILLGITGICVIGMWFGWFITTLDPHEPLPNWPLIFNVGIPNVAIWISYYIVTDQSWLGIFFRTYILR